MAYLFDTDAVSEVAKPRPATEYVRWLNTIPRQDQFVSAVTVAELYYGARRSRNPEHHLENIEARVLPAVTVLPFAVAAVYGRIRAELEQQGKPLADADLQIAATAIHHGLEIVSGDLKHFDRVSGLVAHPVLRQSRMK